MKQAKTLLILILGLLLAAAPLLAQEGIPEAISVFIEALNAHSYELAAPHLGAEFNIEGVPKEFRELALKQIFALFPYTITEQQLISASADGKTFRVLLIRTDGEREIDFTLDEEGKLMSTTLFQAAVKPASQQQPRDLPAYAEARFELVQNLIFLQGELNGEKTVFLLDSGAPLLVLNSKYEASENTIILSQSAGVGGSIGGVGTTRVQSFSWAGGSYADLDVITMDLSHLEETMGRSFAGLISMAELEPFETHINYKKKTLKLYRLDEQGNHSHKLPKAKSVIPFRQEAHIPVIEARIGSFKLNLGLDTGAQSNLLDLAYYNDLLPLISKVQADTVLGADARSMEVNTGLIKKTRVASKNYGKMRYAFSDLNILNEAYNLSLNGLLGHPFLSKQPFSLNYRKRELILY